MIRSFRNRGTEDVYDGIDSKAARKVCPHQIWSVVQRKLSMLDAARDLRDLRSPGNQLHELEEDRAGQWAIRINDQYRVCFFWEEQGATEVEVTDYH